MLAPTPRGGDGTRLPASDSPVANLPAGQRPLDVVLLAAILLLTAIGTVEIFSASAVYALDKHGDAAYFVKRQLAWLALGLVALGGGAVADHRWLRRHTYTLLCFAIALLAAVLIWGVTINSARRWFLVGSFSVQPAEIGKIALISYLATSLGRKADKVKTFTVGFVPHLVVCAVMMGLLLAQPDLGSAAILGATTLAMLFVAGTKISYIVLAVLATAPVAYQLVVDTPWRLQRILAFINPEAFQRGAAYQVVQARIALGSGGVTGRGLGAGRQQLGYMPEGYSDFIMASVGEELGYLGFCAVLLLVLVILWRGMRAALGAPESFAVYLAFGITFTVALQAFIHVAVVLGVLPAKGLTLPLVSYGGSSLLSTMFLLGVLLHIGRRTPPARRRRRIANRAGAVRRRRKAIVVCGS